MADTNEGTAPVEGEAQPTAQADAGTPPQPDEVTTLRSRNAGLDAKVTELQRKATEAERKAAEAAQKLSDYESGKVQADEALRAQVAAKDAELALVRKEATLTRIESKYPETFGVLGEAAAALTEDQLAASEARMSGAGLSSDPPSPLGANPSRGVAGRAKAIEDMTVEELRKHLHTFSTDVLTTSRGH
jgi:hypothetical protein